MSLSMTMAPSLTLAFKICMFSYQSHIEILNMSYVLPSIWQPYGTTSTLPVEGPGQRMLKCEEDCFLVQDGLLLRLNCNMQLFNSPLCRNLPMRFQEIWLRMPGTLFAASFICCNLTRNGLQIPVPHPQKDQHAWCTGAWNTFILLIIIYQYY